MGLFGSIGKAVGGAVSSVADTVSKPAAIALNPINSITAIGINKGMDVAGFDKPQPNSTSSAQQVIPASDHASDYAAGYQTGKALLPEGTLPTAMQDQGVQSILSQMKDYAQNGYGAQVNNAQLSQMQSTQNSNNQVAQSQLQHSLASMGVRGASAADQMQQLLVNQNIAGNNAAQNLMIQNAGMQQNALNTYGAAYASALGQSMGQQTTEKMIPLQFAAGEAGLNNAQTIAQMQLQNTNAMPTSSGSSGISYICTVLRKHKWISKQELDKFHVFMFKSVFTNPLKVIEYLIKGRKVAKWLDKQDDLFLRDVANRLKLWHLPHRQFVLNYEIVFRTLELLQYYSEKNSILVEKK